MSTETPSPQLLITTGPTREFIDVVRFFSNRSTGAMGIALAQAALKRQWGVTLICGPIALTPPSDANVVNVVSAQDMFEAVSPRFSKTDAFISAAAVADYRPAKVHDGKLKKQDGGMMIEMERTPDILKWCGEHKQPHQRLVGFALEADPDPALAETKMQRKNCDILLHNSPENFGKGGGLTRLLEPGNVIWQGNESKPVLAERVISELAERLPCLVS